MTGVFFGGFGSPWSSMNGESNVPRSHADSEAYHDLMGDKYSLAAREAFAQRRAFSGLWNEFLCQYHTAMAAHHQIRDMLERGYSQ